ncbi:MAG: hypothetical protein XD91_0005 [Clostridiales bacterium 38_11]|nr:MAG: hypothetical protein XD91_0005 [Clostridiales bacterium 38_11]
MVNTFVLTESVRDVMMTGAPTPTIAEAKSLHAK